MYAGAVAAAGALILTTDGLGDGLGGGGFFELLEGWLEHMEGYFVRLGDDDRIVEVLASGSDELISEKY